MLIAREKRKSNIAEYILYMWQVEDTIRAFGFDTGRLNRELAGQFDQPDAVKQEIREWYENIAAHMINEKVEQAGHTQFIKNVVNELYNYHLFLLKQPYEAVYSDLFSRVRSLTAEMRSMGKGLPENEIEAILNVVYIYMMMRLKKERVSHETDQAVKLFIRFLALLSSKFMSYEEAEKHQE